MMTYNHTSFEQYRCALFEIDIDEKVLSQLPPDPKVKRWLNHNKTRIAWRLYYFIDSVLREGFVDPVLVWSNVTTKNFKIHPGLNRVLLRKLLPERPLKGWVIDFHCKSRKQYEGLFNGIKPLERDHKGNRDIRWRMQHRSNVPPAWEDQYDLHTFDNLFVTHIPLKDKYLKNKWDFLSRKTGFTPWVANEKFYSIGTTHSDQDHYEIFDVIGIYQLFLQYFFNYSPERWDRLYYRPKYES
jgi:hypothetical protein